jgi:hypothetical protein
MGYIPVEKEYWTWFVAFKRDVDWQVTKRKGIHEYEVRAFQDTCAVIKTGWRDANLAAR